MTGYGSTESPWKIYELFGHQCGGTLAFISEHLMPRFLCMVSRSLLLCIHLSGGAMTKTLGKYHQMKSWCESTSI
jgi:hypothetical protein